MLDKKLIERRFAAHLHTYNQCAVVQREICKRLGDEIERLIPADNIERALEVGAGTGFLTHEILRRYPAAWWSINELTLQAEPYLTNIINDSDACKVSMLWGDAEKIDLPSGLDLLVSASAIQWFDDIETFIRRVDIREGGYIAISTFTSDNFAEVISAAEVETLPYPDIDNLKRIFKSAGYEVLLSESYRRCLYFDNALEVLRHIKFTGVNGVNGVTWTRGQLEKFCARYETPAKLTYAPIVIIAKKVAQQSSATNYKF